VSKKSFRVYFVTHHDGRLTGVLLRVWDSIFDVPPPSAYGASEDDVYAQLEVLLQEREVTGKDPIDRYLWDESFETRLVTVDVHPQSAVAKRKVIGKKEIPLRMTYAWSKLPSGAYRVVLPRFEWRFVLEDLALAQDVLRNAVSTVLLGEKPRWVYDFRYEGVEYLREWTPRFLMRRSEKKAEDGSKESLPTLESLAEDLVDKAFRGRVPPVLGDSAEHDQHLWCAARTPPRSILLVGGPGVGKTAWVRRLARTLAVWRKEGKHDHVPRIWATSGDRIIAGMVYLGMWQERCLKIVDELFGEGHYLYVDRLTSILAPQPDGGSIAEIFLPAILEGEMSLIAECTEAELEKCQRRAPALSGAFQIVRLAETPASAMPALLAQAQARRGGPWQIHASGLKRLVQHLDMFQKDTRFPGKAFRFLDWLGAESAEAASRVLYARDVSELYSRWSGLPVELIADEVPAPPEEITRALARRIVGQPQAVATAARVLARFKAGLSDPERPCGTLLFIGPTGVGKTELAKQLARTLFGDETRMIRVDMSEYMLPGAAQRLLEVGDGATSLAQAVRQQPLSLILFDELEKAHPEVFDLLLGILGEGRLADSLGRHVDFRMTVICMTSNLGVTEAQPIGFGDAEGGDYLRSVRRHFRPELVNRIDHVISFTRLSPGDVLRIVDLELDKAAARTGLLRRNLTLRVDAAAREVLARLGFHPTRGARPLKRVIEERVIAPVAIEMARDPSLRDRVIRIGAGASGELSVEVVR
jgi:ATP-dependent Clp protease ATP-binding subunit ClpC